VSNKTFGDLNTSIELSLPLSDCLCKPHVLTEVIFALFHHHKMYNAHLPVVIKSLCIRRLSSCLVPFSQVGRHEGRNSSGDNIIAS